MANTFETLTGKQFTAIGNAVFSSEYFTLDVMAHTDTNRPNWAGKFGLYLNGKYESYKTWSAFKRRVLYLIDKHGLKEEAPVMGSFDENGDTI